MTFAEDSYPQLTNWVAEIAELTLPQRIQWVTGSDAEWQEITQKLVSTGTLIQLNPELKPNSFLSRSDPQDVARVEDRTFICSERAENSGATNNWLDPLEMRAKLRDLFKGSMRGRTMYVIPFVMGHLGADNPRFGVEITDSAYVVASMRIMARCGTEVLQRMAQLQADFVPAVHSVGQPLEPGDADVAWPCNATKYIVHFPEERSIWSYGSGYGGNALLGKKCYSLRIASAMAQEEGWLAEHMLILKVTPPDQEPRYLAAAFPSACGKTNLAMLESTLPGWQIETLGDDIAWLQPTSSGQLRAINPEFGLFGVAPGTGWTTNPQAMKAIAQGNSIFTNVALTDDGDVWWEGMTDTPPAHLIDWQGQDWTPDDGRVSSHPNARFCTPIAQCEILAAEYYDPAGVPISAILFGGRRSTAIPLITEARSWAHGVFLGATLSSETTAAAVGVTGVVRRDPMAMLPFIGYNAVDYFQHWLNIGAANTQLPKIFYVNWFRRDAQGSFLWPGFGENIRVLKWVVDRLNGRAEVRPTPLGFGPLPGDLDTTGLDLSSGQLADCLTVFPEEWLAEVAATRAWFSQLGDRLPHELVTELSNLAEVIDQEVNPIPR